MKRSFINLFIIIMILASLIASGDGVTPVHALGSMEVVPSLPPSLPGELIQGYLVGVWGASSTSVFAVGSGNSGYGTATLPLIYRKNDTIWTSVIPPLPPVTPAWNTGSLEAVWGSGDSNVFAVGSGGQDNQLNFPLLSRWNGSTWTSSSPGLPAGFNYGHLYDVWGSGASNVFAVGDGGHTNSTVTYPLLYRYNGSTWTSSSLPLPDGWGHGYLRAVWGSSASNVYAVGFGDMGSASIPLLYHYNGSTWSFSTPSLPTEDWGSGYLNGVWGSGTNDIYAVGSGNNGSSVATLLYHYDGSSWTSSSLPSLSGWSTIRLYSIWGSSANDVYIVGSGIHEGTTLPLLYRKTINGWAASNFLPTGWSSGHFDGIWGSSTTEVYAVGSGRVPNSSGGVDDVPLLARAGPDEVDPGAVNELLATPGPVIGSVNLRWKAPADDAGNNNSGPVDSYLVKYSTSSLADCTGGTPITSGLPLPAAPTTIQAMTISGLTMGEQYYFAVCALDEEDNPSEAATTSAKATARWMHDDLDAGWTYSSGFSILANPGAYLDGIHTVATIGKYAEFTFTGSQFDVLYTANTNRGKVNVFVNGIPIGTMDQYSPTKVLQARWPSRDLGPGDHTVKLVHAGPSGSVMNIDAIEVGDYIPPDGGTYDDLDARWTYSSGFSILANPGAYLDGIHSSTTPDSYAEFTFYGSQFDVLYTANFNRGIATVLVDDLPIGTMDQFSPTKVLQARWPSGDLGPGVHKVKLIHAGPSGSVINIDAIVVPAGPGTYDDLDAGWIYSSGFSILANPGAYLDGIHTAATIGKYAEFTFTGSQFDLLYTANTNRGKVNVLVDGLSIGTMDQYSPTKVLQARWPSGDLGPGDHTVELVHAGPSGSVMNIDAIEVSEYQAPEAGVYDDLDPDWRYSSGFSILANPGAYLDGIHSSTTPDSYAEFTFYGSQFEVLYTANFNRGIATVLVNDLPIGTMDQFSPTKVLQARWPSGDLGPGVHKVKLIHAGPSGSVINIDAIVVPAGPGTYDDLDASWIYSSGFGILANPGAYLDGIHSSTTVGNYAEFTFTGSQFDLLYTANFNRGTADVLVDGLSIGTMDQYSLDRVFQARWPSGDLGPGVHTVKVVHTGPSGSVINIDAIDVP